MTKNKYSVMDAGGNVLYYLNQHLVRQMGITEAGLEEFKCLHQKRVALLRQMEETPAEYTVMLHAFAEALTQIEYETQDAWGFARDKNFHRFWEVPRCCCPRMDNEDAYPTGYYVVNKSCPVHGGY